MISNVNFYILDEIEAILNKKQLPITPAKLQQTNASQLACRRLATR
jgi:hypothetical protein